MHFVLLVVTACTIVGMSSGASMSLNELLRADKLVPEQYDAVQTRSGDILGQLKALLKDKDVSTEMYALYKETHSEMEGTQQAFEDTLIKIAKHNLNFEAGQTTWQMGVNQFTHMTDKQLEGLTTKLFLSNSTLITADSNSHFVGITVEAAPATLDWRTKKIVTPAKDQGQCGSCVTFGTASIVEAAYAKAKGTHLDLSEQELLDCTPENSGCNGGWYTASLTQVQQNGLASESTYPYVAKQNGCQRSSKARAMTNSQVSSQGECGTRGSESVLKDACAGWGPVAVAVSVSNDWYVYKSGIYKGSCATGVNHAIAVVGYGTDHWILKNSWGPKWGEKGFMKLQFGVNKCNVADHCFYIIVK